MLDALNLASYFEEIIDIFDKIKFLLPCAAFIFAPLLTIVLGSSWAMYAIAFPIVIGLTTYLHLDPIVFIGAVSAAGIAGEKNCPFTAEAVNIATAVGISPVAARKVRISYSIVLTVITALCYLGVGFFI